MSDGTSVTLGGFPVLGQSAVGWSIVDGVRPHRQLFELKAEHAQLLLDGRAGAGGRSPGVTLEWKIAGGPTMKAERLYPIALAPAGLPQTFNVLVVDRRFWWQYEHIARGYNIRRKTGQTSRITSEGGPLETQPVIPIIAFAPWSLKNFASGNPTAWTAKDVLEDILDVLTDDHVLINAKYRIDSLGRKLNVENLVIDDRGPEALLRALSFFSGASVYVDYDGTIVVHDTRDGQEARLTKGLTAIPGTTLPVLADHRLTRPKEIRVLFTREVELRFDSVAENNPFAGLEEDEALSCVNVCPLPDRRIVLDSGQELAAGTWLPIEVILNFWKLNSIRNQPVDIDYDLLRKTLFTGSLVQFLVESLTGVDQIHVAARITTAQSAFRHTYRINRQALDRIASLEATRVAILDYTSGARAPAPVYCDWTSLYAARGRLGAQGLFVYGDRHAYATLLSDAERAPFRASIVDSEQGIFRIDAAQDPNFLLNYVAGIPEDINGGPPPDADPRNGNQGGAKNILTQYTALKSDFRLATILTVTPGAPNTEARFHTITVDPLEAAVALGLKADGLGPCDGPPLEVRIGPQLMKAQFAWRDQDAPGLRAMLSIPPYDGDPNSVQPLNQAILHNIAVAAAAAAYATQVTRVEGSMTGVINPALRPLGNAARIAHNLSPDGVATTTVSFPTEIDPPDILSLVRESVRRQILGLVPPERASGVTG